MYHHTLHRGRKYFCRYCLQAFSTEKMLKPHIKDCFNINGKQRIIMPKNGKYVKLRNYEKKLPFKICADFEILLVREGNGRQNPKEFYTNLWL